MLEFQYQILGVNAKVFGFQNLIGLIWKDSSPHSGHHKQDEVYRCICFAAIHRKMCLR